MTIQANPLLEGTLGEEIMEVLASVASKSGDIIHDMDSLQVIQLKGAMTNRVFQINWASKNGDTRRKVLVRLYGEGVEIFFNREEEIRTFKCMSEHRQGPRFLGQLTAGRVEEFIHARTLSAAELRNPEISALIASKMREFHNLDMPGPKSVQLWNRMRNWLSQAKSLCSSQDTETFGLDNLDEEINMLEKLLSEGNQEIGFCHNDLQYDTELLPFGVEISDGQFSLYIGEHCCSFLKGILNLNASDLEFVVDYEYASYNPIAYDLANHFCEMVADYHTDTPHLLEYSKYPDLEERQRFAHVYLSSEGKNPSNAEVEQLVDDAERYTIANHLFWGLWGLISSYVNKIEFDYKEYARQRFDQYWLRKSTLLE